MNKFDILLINTIKTQNSPKNLLFHLFSKTKIKIKVKTSADCISINGFRTSKQYYLLLFTFSVKFFIRKQKKNYNVIAHLCGT